MFLQRIRFYSFERFLVRLLANFFIPIYFIISRRKKNYSLLNTLKKERRIIISLTTMPQRINRVWVVIESILHQEILPDLIVLWLSKEQFPEKEKLPKRLLKLQDRGLEIKICEGDLKSHKKYYYAIQEYQEDYIITIDDDVFCKPDMIKCLINTNNKFPRAICCNQAAIIKTENSIIEPYQNWELCNEKGVPRFDLMPIGVGGVLYPPGSLYPEVLNKKLITQLCFYADDIWLNAMSRLQGSPVVLTSYESGFIPVISNGKVSLNSINVFQGKNNEQINAVRNYYIKNKKMDPFDLVGNSNYKK